MGHTERIAHHRKDGVHARMVLDAVGLRRQLGRERLLAAGAPQHLALVDRRLNRRLSLQFHVLVRGVGVIELAGAQRFGTWGARLQVGMRNRHVLGGRVVTGSVASVAFLLFCRVSPFPATLRCGPGRAPAVATSDEVAQGLEQYRMRFHRKLSSRQAFFQPH